MAKSINAIYPTQSNAPDANYPAGSAKNVTVPGDGTGTPWEQQWVNDLEGFKQALLSTSGLVVSGAAETSLVSQYLDAVMGAASKSTWKTEITYAIGDIVRYNGRSYEAFTASQGNNPEQNLDEWQPVRDYDTWPEGIMRSAHRGAPIAYPENTIVSINACIGMDGCEFDVRLTSDDEWVLMHDDTVDRTTDGSGLVTSFTLAGIRALDAGSWFNAYFTNTRVPTLEEALIACKNNNLRPIVEIKVSGASNANRQKLIDACVKHFGGYDFTIASGSSTELKAYQSLDRRLNFILFESTDVNTFITNAAGLYSVVAGLNKGIDTAVNIKTLKDLGYKAITWTVISAKEQDDAINAGADGFLTDNLTGVKFQ